MSTTPRIPAATAARVAPDAEVVRQGYQALNAGDIGLLHDVFDVEARWHTPGRSPIAGDRQGRAAVFAQFARYGGETEGTFRATLQRVLADDDGHVVALHHATALRKGRRLGVECCVAFEVRGGRIVDGREHFVDLPAWDAFWA